MPSFLPSSPSIAMALQLDFDIDASRELQAHQRIDGLARRLDDVDQPLMRADLELLARILIEEGRAVEGDLLDTRRQRHRASHSGACAFRRLDDLPRGLIEDAVVERLETDPDLLPWHR